MHCNNYCAAKKKSGSQSAALQMEFYIRIIIAGDKGKSKESLVVGQFPVIPRNIKGR
jgi:hypothetical protein